MDARDCFAAFEQGNVAWRVHVRVDVDYFVDGHVCR